MKHGDAIPLAAGGIVPVSFLSHGVRVQKKKKIASLSPGVSRLGVIGPPSPSDYDVGKQHALPELPPTAA